MNTRPQKIALVYDAIFPFYKGGAEKRFYEIGRRFAKNGYDVHLYGMKSWKGADTIKHEGMTIHGICKNYPLYTKSGRRSISQAVLFGIASLSLWREPFDVIDCCGFPYFSLFPMRLIAWLRRKKLYSTWHEAWGLDYWKQYLGIMGIMGYLIERVSVLLPDTMISVSENTANAISLKLNRKHAVITIPNGLDIKRINSLQAASEKSDVIFVGRLLSHKNVDILIRAVHILAKDYPEISLTIIGDGPERKTLEELAIKLNLSKNVRFLGFIENEDETYGYMLSSKILVLPSTREGFGIVILEANACGLPVITIDHPQNAARDLVSEGANGMICRLDESTLAKTIEHLLQFRKERSFYMSCINLYDWDAVMLNLEKAYFSLG